VLQCIDEAPVIAAAPGQFNGLVEVLGPLLDSEHRGEGPPAGVVGAGRGSVVADLLCRAQRFLAQSLDGAVVPEREAYVREFGQGAGASDCVVSAVVG